MTLIEGTNKRNKVNNCNETSALETHIVIYKVHIQGKTFIYIDGRRGRVVSASSK